MFPFLQFSHNFKSLYFWERKKKSHVVLYSSIYYRVMPFFFFFWSYIFQFTLFISSNPTVGISRIHIFHLQKVTETNQRLLALGFCICYEFTKDYLNTQNPKRLLILLCKSYLTIACGECYLKHVNGVGRYTAKRRSRELGKCKKKQLLNITKYYPLKNVPKLLNSNMYLTCVLQIGLNCLLC